MKVILKENIETLGHIGDIVKVAPGYARNYLLPKGLAIEATTKNAKALEHAKRQMEYKKNKVLEQAKAAGGQNRGAQSRPDPSGRRRRETVRCGHQHGTGRAAEGAGLRDRPEEDRAGRADQACGRVHRLPSRSIPKSPPT